jgi:indolepyruvate ferredoxin oxidoreductase beta subunit
MPDPGTLFAARELKETDAVIKLAILAVGGQGGGVLSDWIVGAAERSGYVAQSTSVAGVAQRTGATIYYVEMAPDSGRLPVFALSPSPGDVDILIAAELMEAGRAIMRGFVTPERTTLIASSHRIAAVSEKVNPGDGRASSPTVAATAELAAKRFVSFDMEKIAAESGTMISASLFGALAGSGVLPFPRSAYEETVGASGRGVKQSLSAFGKAFDRAAGGLAQPSAPVVAQGGPADVAAVHLPLRSAPNAASVPKGPGVSGPSAQLKNWQALVARVEALPKPVHDMATRGLRKVVDFQDLAYGAEYLDLLSRAVALDGAERGYALSIAAAKHLANALTYDDIIRVADLKTRSSRGARVKREVGVAKGAVLQVTEYFHPRVEEFCGTLPAGLGRYIEARPRLAAFIDRRINKGRRIRTDSFTGFAMLWVIGGLRRFRRSLLRHAVESAHLERWFALALSHAAANYDLAVEILNCRRLIKGYSDTHVRGLSKFDRVLSAVPLLKARTDGGDWLRRLREAALKDEKGDMLDGALKTVASLDEMPSSSLH